MVGEMRLGLSLSPYTMRYAKNGGSVVFPFRTEFERDLIMRIFAQGSAALDGQTPNLSPQGHSHE